MKLVDNVIRSMRVGKVFRDNQDSINNIHFSSDGASLISSAEDDQIVIYDCERGIQKRTINSKKYGVDLIHFTQNKAHVVHASTKGKSLTKYLHLPKCVNGTSKISIVTQIANENGSSFRKRYNSLPQCGREQIYFLLSRT